MDDVLQSAIPGLASTYPNSHVTNMKAASWSRVLNLWGNEGERAMLDLVLDCGIFTPVIWSNGIYTQLSGL
jgi:telomerase reverse transcriptase